MRLALATTLLAATAGGATAQSVASPPVAQAETARRLLQHAVHLEEAVGDPEAAIAAYEGVIASPDADAPVTAVAEFRLAVLFDRLGRDEESRSLHRRIAARYSDDPRLLELVRLARAALGDPDAGGGSDSMVARRLWAGSEAYAYGALAPDGSYLSFVDWTSGNLAVHDLDRESKRYLTHRDPLESPRSWACSTAVAPDGNRIAYTLVRDEVGHEIRLVQADGNGDRLLVKPGPAPRHVELEGWSRDGRSLVAQIFREDASAELVLIAVEDGSIRPIRELGTPAPEVVSLSPDGDWIAYHLEAEDGSHDIHVTPASGGDARAVVRHPANDLFPLWTPDGRHLLFVSDRTGGLAAWALAVVDGEAAGPARLVKSDFGRSLPMGFTEHGALIYAVQTSMNDVYTGELELDSGAVRDRTVSSGRYVGVNRSPAWSSDGRSLVYLSDRGPLPAGMAPTSLVVRDRHSGEERTLTTELRQPTEPRWQPGQKAIWLEARDPDQGWGIYRIPLDDREPERIAGWQTDICVCGGSPAVSERHVAFLLPADKDDGSLVLQSLADGSRRTLAEGLAPADLAALRFSPDGTRLALAVRRPGEGERRWQLEVIGTGSARLEATADLGTDGEAVEIVGWPREDRLLAIARRDGDRRFLVAELPTGAVRVLPTPVSADVRQISLHPDGRSLVFAAGSYRSEIWMLENPLAPVSETD